MHGYRHGGSLIDTFMHGAVWAAARRLMYAVPFPVIVVIAIACIVGYVTRALRRRAVNRP